MTEQKTLFEAETPEPRITEAEIQEMVDNPLEYLELIVRTYYPEFSGGIHPACMASPMIDRDSFDELVDNIRSQGLNQSIMRTDDRQLLDGKARLLACFVACQDIRTEDLGTIIDPWEHVWTVNFCRTGVSSVTRRQMRENFKFPAKVIDNPF